MNKSTSTQTNDNTKQFDVKRKMAVQRECSQNVIDVLLNDISKLYFESIENKLNPDNYLINIVPCINLYVSSEEIKQYKDIELLTRELSFDSHYYEEDKYVYQLIPATQQNYLKAYCPDYLERQKVIQQQFDYYRTQNKLIICVDWKYKTTDGLIFVSPLHYAPNHFITGINKPFKWEKAKTKTVVKKPKAKSEATKEKELLKWLNNNGIKADNQVSLNKNRADIWIPGVCFLELKRNKISSDDLCQAINYYIDSERKVILVGTGTTNSRIASTITSFNKLVGCDAIAFLTYDTIKVYLKGLLGI